MPPPFGRRHVFPPKTWCFREFEIVFAVAPVFIPFFSSRVFPPLRRFLGPCARQDTLFFYKKSMTAFQGDFSGFLFQALPVRMRIFLLRNAARKLLSTFAFPGRS